MDKYYLQRFLEAQKRSFDTAYKEICNGRKKSHWMWFIFPQMRGLGHSEISTYYGITCLDEAKAYLEHPILGENLLKITSALLSLSDNDPELVMGSPDDFKLRSSMTLFLIASGGNKLFYDVIEKYYHGKLDKTTIELLNA